MQRVLATFLNKLVVKDPFAAGYHPGSRLLGISTVNGNASLLNATNNALRVLSAAGLDKHVEGEKCQLSNVMPPYHSSAWHSIDSMTASRAGVFPGANKPLTGQVHPSLPCQSFSTCLCTQILLSNGLNARISGVSTYRAVLHFTWNLSGLEIYEKHGVL